MVTVMVSLYLCHCFSFDTQACPIIGPTYMALASYMKFNDNVVVLQLECFKQSGTSRQYSSV